MKVIIKTLTEALHALVSAYHRAPEAVCPRCGSNVWDSIQVAARGPASLADAVENLEGWLATLEE